jgi:outer membrane murein-binding lipoprotein Lpp
MKNLIFLLVAAAALSSCYTTHGCVKDAKHNQKVAKHRHHQRAKHRNSSTNW